VSTTTAPRVEPERARLEIAGMTCASCGARVERRLAALDGVDTCSVSHATDEAIVTFDPELVTPGDLIGAVEAEGFRAAIARAAGDPLSDTEAFLARRLALALLLTAPLAVVAMIPSLRFPGWEWLALALATPVVFVAGAPFHRAALANVRHGAATMDTLVSLGTIAAWAWSTVVLLASLDADTYFEVAAVITTAILLGRLLETRARRRSGDAIRALLQLGAKQAHVLREGEEVTVDIDQLAVGDRFVVRPGEKVATDGLVEEGASAIDRSLLTGEPVPQEVRPGDPVAGATLNTYGRLVVRAASVGADTMLGQIARLVAEAQARKAPIQRLTDRISAVFVPIVIGISLATLAGWLLLQGDAGDAFTAAVAVLIIACPCALGLATPTALTAAIGRGAQLGILIRRPEILESARRVTTVVLDKTGTVTEGQLELVDVAPLRGGSRADVLRLAGAVEAASEHPVGRTVAAAARAELGGVPSVEEFRSLAGVGVSGIVDGRQVRVDRRDGAITVAADGSAIGTLVVRDSVKPSSAEAVRALEKLGLTPLLMTGDDPAAAGRIAGEIGVERVLAEVLPDEKAAEVRRLQERGEVVAMVGDGVNDAPALAQADLGLALGTGTDAAIEAADVTLVSGDLRAVGDAVRLARRTLRTIRQNLFWAFAYNIAAIPLAVAGLLDPMVAAAAMACSSVFVVVNSLRLRRFRSRRKAEAT
jgi:Cu+-exporting ATPase